MIQPAKKKKIPDLMWHSMVRKACAMMNVQIMFMLTAKKNPAVRVSRGKISLGINQPRGPQDQAKPDTKKQIKNTTMYAYNFGIWFVECKYFSRMTPVTTCTVVGKPFSA